MSSGALKPDCVVYAASGPERDALAIPDYVRLLEAGINVVTTSTTRLVNPHAYEPVEWRDQMVAAAKQGQIRLIADALGVEVQEVREEFGRAVTNRTLEVAMGTVEAGTTGALRMKAIGVVDGREAIEHVTRLAHDVAPESAICPTAW